MPNVSAPKYKKIAGQPHQLSYINKFESELLKAIGGSGMKTKEGIPSYFIFGGPSGFGDFEFSGGDATNPLSGIGTDFKKSFTSEEDWSDSGFNETYQEYQDRTDVTRKKHEEWMKANEDRGGSSNNNAAAVVDPNIAIDEGLAASYNTDIDAFNTAYDDIAGRVGGFGDVFSGLGYEDYFGNTVGDVTGAVSGLEGLLSELGDLSAPEMPEFATDTQFDLGTARDTSALSNQISGLIGDAQDLADERALQERNYGRIATNLSSDLGQLERELGRLDFADTNLIDNLEDDYYRLTEAADALAQDNVLYDQLGLDYDGLGILDDIGGLREDYRNEEDRISGFASDLLRDYGLYSDELADYDITNEEELQALEETVKDLIRDARYFDSDLDYDFSREVADLTDLRDDVSGLLQDRTDEFDRIERAQDDALSTAQILDRQGDVTDIYNLSDIDLLQDAIDAANAEISGFSSLLPYDFSNTTDPLTSAQTDVTNLYDARKSALDLIDDPIAGLQEDLIDLDLYDEQGMRNIDDRLSNLGIDLSSYTGGRVIGIKNKINLATGAVDAKIRELENYRGDIEDKARLLQQEFDDATYYTLDDLSDPEERLAAQQKEAELYNALQALDEIQSAQTRLNEERARLEQDAANVAAREGSGTDMVLDQISTQALSNPDLISPEMLGGLTLEEYLAMLGGGDEEQNLISPSGTFSQNVIVGA